jgi:phosphoribosylcarboxyaminoimidazole (NCAIR) mutase
MVPVGTEDSPTSDSVKRSAAPYRAPRIALIVVLPENHVVSADRLAERLRAHGDQRVDVVVACAGQPANLAALHQSVGDAQFLLAPAGTSTEDLRELAMRQVPADIVTLLSGAAASEAGADSELFMTS